MSAVFSGYPNVKNTESFYYFDYPFNTTTSYSQPRFYGPIVIALMGFYCTLSLRLLFYILSGAYFEYLTLVSRSA